MFGINDKQEFLHSLKYTECSECGNTMFCRWGCMLDEFPKGMADYEHPRWEEIIRVYLKYYEANDITSDQLAEHVRRARVELKRREDVRD